MHGRKETNRAELPFGQTPLEPLVGTCGRRVVHEESDEPSRVSGDGLGNRRFVAGNAGHDGGTGDPVAIELGHPSIREAGHAARGIPLERRGDGLRAAPVAGQRFEKS